MYAVIMAGGSGTRLWPTSRSSHPKQFHSLITDKSLLGDTIERISPFIKKRKIFIISNQKYKEKILEAQKEIFEKNILLEPIGKNTAPAIGLMAALIAKKDPEAIIAALPSDHYIENRKEFLNVLALAQRFLRQHPEYILTIGIRPLYPETGYGYILLGKEIDGIGGQKAGDHKIFKVKQFVEKPDSDRAKKFVMTWGYLWNSGMFVFEAKNILKIFRKYLPDVYKSLIRIQKAAGTGIFSKILEEEYSKIEPISLDYGILEKYNKVAVVPADLGWSDIGGWASLLDLLSKGEEENVIRGKHIGVDTKECLIFSKNKLIATVGLERMIIVETEDSIFICPKEKSQKVRDLIEKLKKEKRHQYL